MSDSDENEMKSIEGHYDHSIFLNLIDDEADNEEYKYYAEPSIRHPSEENLSYSESHYINEDHRYFQQKEAQRIYEMFENPLLIEFRTTEERLTQFPEMRLIPAKRHPHRTSLNQNNSILVDDISLPAETSPTKLYYPKPRASPPAQREYYLTPVTEMTLLPDRYFQKRLTVTAKQAGFISDCATCDTCDFVWRQDSLYQSHLRKHDDYGSGNIISLNIGLLCPVHNCKTRCDSVATIVKHMKLSHDIDDLPFEHIIFKDVTEFKLWKVELERLTTARFVPSSAKRNRFSKSTFYQCHTSGRVQYQDTDKARNRRSRKVGKTCTAFFNIRENDDGTVLLRGCMKHFGHEMDVKSLPVTKDIQMEIANLLIEGYDELEVADQMRSMSDPMDRRYYLQNYEVRNVMVKIENYKVEYKKKMLNGEKLPSLVDICKKPQDQQGVVFPIVKAKLARSRYPTYQEPFLRIDESMNKESDLENQSPPLMSGEAIDNI